LVFIKLNYNMINHINKVNIENQITPLIKYSETFYNITDIPYFYVLSEV